MTAKETIKTSAVYMLPRLLLRYQVQRRTGYGGNAIGTELPPRYCWTYRGAVGCARRWEGRRRIIQVWP